MNYTVKDLVSYGGFIAGAIAGHVIMTSMGYMGIPRLIVAVILGVAGGYVADKLMNKS